MIRPRVLVVNAGSSSLKLRVVGADGRVEIGEDLGPPGPDLAARLASFVGRAGTVDATGHRVVHGGSRFTGPVVVDARVRLELDELSVLAPLHNPPALAAIDALAQLRPAMVAVACFDTAFHVTIPPAATSYALPAEWTARWGIRRYGFHGLSCTWSTCRAATMVGTGTPPGRLVVCHLGSGASVTAVAAGRSVDTSMGFTPLQGLVMATRAGDVDPGAITWLVSHGVGVEELDDALEHRSGLAALAELPSGDMRAVLDRRAAGDAGAGLAVDVYLHRLRAGIAAMVATLGGLDTLVFTGGVGECSPVIRAEVCDRLDWLGVGLDHAANDAVGGADADISAVAARVRTLVVHAREESVIAEETRRLLGRPHPRPTDGDALAFPGLT